MPTPVPTDTPIATPTVSPTPTPTAMPMPTDTPTATPTFVPTVLPTDTPTPTPTATPDGIGTSFADGFESGDLRAWSGLQGNEEDLRVNAQAARFGGAGLEVVIDDVEPRRVERDGLGDLAQAHARFYFVPNGLSMAADDTFVLAQLRDSQERSARVELGYDGMSYRLRFGLFHNSEGWLDSEWVSMSDGWHAVEFSFVAASGPGADDGHGELWLDGSSGVTLSGISNEARRVDRLYLGPLWGLDVGTAGSLYFDQVEVATDHIGLEGDDVTPTPVPMGTPTVTPTAMPATTPTPTPAAAPMPTGTPTATPTMPPTNTPTVMPTVTPTMPPTDTPTPMPTATDTPTPLPPTDTPTPTPLPPTDTPTPVPTATDVLVPTPTSPAP
jgi:hypothetical protein